MQAPIENAWVTRGDTLFSKQNLNLVARLAARALREHF